MPSRTGSSGRPGSPPTSATSCARPSPRCRPPSRCWTVAATSCPNAASRRSTSWSTRSSRFDQMVLDLLELSRLEAGVDESHQEPVVLADTVKRIAARNGCSDVPVRCHPPLGGRRHPRQRRLERIVVNLLDNAKHHADGPSRIAVEDGSRGTLRLVVEDSGPGVPPGERDRIFERFYRGTEARRRVGTGLGLALVKRARHGHGRAGMGRGPAVAAAPASSCRSRRCARDDGKIRWPLDRPEGGGSGRGGGARPRGLVVWRVLRRRAARR